MVRFLVFMCLVVGCPSTETTDGALLSDSGEARKERTGLELGRALRQAGFDLLAAAPIILEVEQGDKSPDLLAATHELLEIADLERDDLLIPSVLEASYSPSFSKLSATDLDRLNITIAEVAAERGERDDALRLAHAVKAGAPRARASWLIANLGDAEPAGKALAELGGASGDAKVRVAHLRAEALASQGKLDEATKVAADSSGIEAQLLAAEIAARRCKVSEASALAETIRVDARRRAEELLVKPEGFVRDAVFSELDREAEAAITKFPDQKASIEETANAMRVRLHALAVGRAKRMHDAEQAYFDAIAKRAEILAALNAKSCRKLAKAPWARPPRIAIFLRPAFQLPEVVAIPSDPPPSDLDSRPDWVRRGSVCEEKICYGVGFAKGIRNKSLLRTTADNRARAQIGQQITKSKTFSLNLSGVEIVDHYLDPKGGLYSLARYEPM